MIISFMIGHHVKQQILKGKNIRDYLQKLGNMHDEVYMEVEKLIIQKNF